MSDTLSYTGELTVLTCWCGMRHAVPEELRRHQLRQHNNRETVIGIYCPLGHSHVPAGKGEAEKERERRERAEARAKAIQDQLDSETRAHAATKGQLTKTRKRVTNGVCPCCGRSFANVQRHMRSKHPNEIVKPSA